MDDKTAPSNSKVLKQSGRATFPLLLKDDTDIKDGFIQIKFKAVAGAEDRAGGVVWRARDANNYYVARANAIGALFMHMISTVAEAKAAARAGVDVIVAQGTEGGGHVGVMSTLPLVPQVVDAVDGVPVLAAGGRFAGDDGCCFERFNRI